jgi:toxin-antitoxin system PIN domain toxin
MIAVDTNILVYAHREEFPEHPAARAWLEELADGTALWGIPVFCLGEFIRVTTHPRILKPPSAAAAAGAALEVLLDSASLRILYPGERFPRLVLELIRTHKLTGNLAFDAQIAAVCLENGVREIRSNDRDFDRIKELRRRGL